MCCGDCVSLLLCGAKAVCGRGSLPWDEDERRLRSGVVWEGVKGRCVVEAGGQS